MLHVTQHYDAGDIDKHDKSPFKKSTIVYHPKRRFNSLHINMHYSQTFDAVGQSTGDKELDAMRFRTTQMDTHNDEKVKFGVRANPPTMFEEMARQSHLKMKMDTKPRRGDSERLSQSGMVQASPFGKTLGETWGQRGNTMNAASVMAYRNPDNKLHQRLAATEKKLQKARPTSLIDVDHRREIYKRQQKLEAQLARLHSVTDKAP